MSEAIDVLAFGPHPDDVELFCGGTLRRLADLGHRTAVVDLTRGERASAGTPEERARETEAASAVLGLAHRENLALPDTGLDAASRAQITACVEVLRRLRPELVLIPWIHERHPDHVAAAALLGKALAFAAIRKVETVPPSSRFVPRQVFHYAMRHHMTATLVVDTSAAQPKKLEAIRCYASQVTRRPGGDATLISAPLAIDAIDARDRYYGSMIGVSHGEPLRARSVLGVVDPLRLVRDNPFPEAHAFEPPA
jgi:bacillithiol biosynthesis deacetylase BshB1